MKKKKASRGSKETPLVNNSLLSVTVSFAAREHQQMQPRRRENGKKRKREQREQARRHDGSEKLAVSIERIIRSLKNTWTIIKPICQR